jgi:hypothetical protein
MQRKLTLLAVSAFMLLAAGLARIAAPITVFDRVSPLPTPYGHSLGKQEVVATQAAEVRTRVPAGILQATLVAAERTAYPQGRPTDAVPALSVTPTPSTTPAAAVGASQP